MVGPIQAVQVGPAQAVIARLAPLRRPGRLPAHPGQWKASPDLTEAQRAGIAAYEALIAQLRQVNSEVLAVAAELASTIETVLAKSDLELGIEALMRGLRP